MNRFNDFDIFKVRSLAQRIGMSYPQLRNCLRGRYNSWTEQDRAKLFNAMYSGFEKACAAIGFTTEGRPIKKKD